MKGKTKVEKGITLIALIITIVVLLILAAVAISSIQNDGILHYATNAADNWNKALANEANTLGDYVNYLNSIGSGSGNGSGGVTIGDATVGTKVDKLSTINGQQYNENNPVIPAGFIAINTTASSWDATDLAAEVKKGLVITDSVDSEGSSNGNEFVWIPVANISEMAKVTSDVDANGRTNYEGVLYDFSKADDGTLKAEKKLNYGQSTTSFREPANLTAIYDSNDLSDEADKFTLTTIKNVWDANYYQESFNKMVESVIEYKGFYVGRYEMSYNTTTNKAQSQAKVSPVYNNEANNWWGLYEKATTYGANGVISEMIWGCQYDAMMRWMQGNNIDITSKTPIDTNRGVVASKHTGGKTGTSNDDILNNVYDLIGNYIEWTQEALDKDIRVLRGGYRTAILDASASNRSESYYGYPTNAFQHNCTRLTLYVEK